HFCHSNFRLIKSQIDRPFDRLFIDLGVSSHQLDRADRGFSFQKDGPLDMRMNPNEGEPISDWLAHCSEDELRDVLFEYGEESRAKFIARKWVDVRRRGPITTTKNFVEALGSSLTAKNPKGRHPLTRVFQALRMKANDEFSVLQELIRDLPEILSINGRVGILTFHSLEDREVKWGLKGRLTPVNKKVLQASREESRENPRSRSAKLRVYTRELKNTEDANEGRR
ncbi:MAG: S-adenosyl-methyltransferase MraW, partial [Bacteriovoracaceae bacterium]|nr:S-adenosyl-methyltransferase MraW [Bacteriovoracaceae bacterium]